MYVRVLGSNKSDPPSSDVLIPVADKFCCCMPDKYRQKCNCESHSDKVTFYIYFFTLFSRKFENCYNKFQYINT